jgi:hypothetical protein
MRPPLQRAGKALHKPARRYPSQGAPARPPRPRPPPPGHLPGKSKSKRPARCTNKKISAPFASVVHGPLPLLRSSSVGGLLSAGLWCASQVTTQGLKRL